MHGSIRFVSLAPVAAPPAWRRASANEDSTGGGLPATAGCVTSGAGRYSATRRTDKTWTCRSVVTPVTSRRSPTMAPA